MRASWSLLVLAACGDKVIELEIAVPTSVPAGYDTSCVRAVELYLDGGNYPADDEDWELDCVDLDAPATTMAEVREQIRGRFETKLPASGLSGVELFAYTGPCNAAIDSREFDLIFYGSGPYVGGDTITATLTPNLSCKPVGVQIKPVDVLKLVTGGCVAAEWTTGKLGLATLSPLPFTDESYWWGGTASPIVGGVASVTGNIEAGPRSCLAASLYVVDEWLQVTCLPPANQRACATGNVYEAPMVSYAVWGASQDQVKLNEHGSLIIGAVYGTAPVANATVTIDDADKDKGEVVYFDLPPGVEAGTGALTPRPGASTGPSGLFGIYTMSLINVTITANGTSVKRWFGANSEGATAVIVRL